ncbi:cation transporter [Ideonella livida]|uniref:Cation transporter n=1 Tax=Ideonella livida TaxID=2707176 RepID=A0A7C9PFN3_9BURK|nr:cation transporter [Ideonella livida]NDY90252.1 cation transporter [Ideonella livida]
MSASCCAPLPPSADPRFRRALWIALWVNALMFVVESWAGWASGSVALLADAVDFFGDAVNYGVSLAVLGMTVAVRARTAQFKAICMAGFGVLVLGRALWAWQTGSMPEPATMGVLATLALLANVGVALLLYRHRTGDANMRSVWICSRNDAVGNVAVGLAALGVLGTGSPWPDLGVAAFMAVLALSGAATVWRQATTELATAAAPAGATGATAAHHGAPPAHDTCCAAGPAPRCRAGNHDDHDHGPAHPPH